ncbi:MAG: DUF4870 domain-containing protein [Burkholderiales bacterium]|jgi:uncharacterized Tic20 family protein|nr:DUF4870 domain-containing protein [Burkholderiales bacterium]
MTDLNDTSSGSPAPEEKTMAMLAHLLGILTGFIGALIIWLISKDKNPAQPFATSQAKEALNFQITILIATVVCWILMFVLIGAILIFVVIIFNIVFCIIAGIKANNGEEYRYPLALRLIK